ncbi:MAG: TIGR04283 family arsenosugar biosynthesis glycosyltransferase [Mogibacterium sp.]|nr:TIGR04283 family arsenosugar biosynthesis glycosyltransferase [Mogibacterium sp.]
MTALTEGQINKGRNALIVFTREPEPGKTKTRLMPYFSPEQCAELHRCMLKDIGKEMKRADADLVVAYTCEEGETPSFLRGALGRNTLFIRQRGENIGFRMQNAIEDVLSLGYSKAVLIGTDIPELKSETIDASLTLLASYDVVLGPTCDGGYYLIGMKAVHPEAFNVEVFGVSSVFDETVSSIKKAGLTVGKTDTYADMDIPDDLDGFRTRMRRDARLRRSNTGRFLAEKAKISVIVPVYNEAAEIRNMMRQLMPYREECEIIIVDGGSTDNTPDIIHECTGEALGAVRILKDARSRAVQMNAGAKASTGDILFFLHCDSVLPARFTEEIRRVMTVNDWGCFRVKFSSLNFFMLTNCIISNHRALCRRIPFGDQGIFIDRHLFFEAGQFPEMPLMEDYEFSLRMKCRKDIKGPGMTQKTLTTSARRYGKGTISIFRTEMQMWKLRYMYRKGVSTDRLRSMYDDIR